MKPATVLAIGGWDPTSGAGIAADVRAVQACGAYALTALTGLAVQTVDRVLDVQPVTPETLTMTLDEALGGLPVDAVKTGMLGNERLAGIVFDHIRQLDAPWVYDPVGHATDGTALGQGAFRAAFPRRAASYITPNRDELRALTGHDDAARGAAALFEAGFNGVLVKGGHAESREVVDTLYVSSGETYMHERPRFAGTLHGSGCILASAFAAGLASGGGCRVAFRAAESFMDRVWETSWEAAPGVRLGTTLNR